MNPEDTPPATSDTAQPQTVWPFLLLNFCGILFLPFVCAGVALSMYLLPTWTIPIVIVGPLYGLLVGLSQKRMLPSHAHQTWLLGNALAGFIAFLIVPLNISPPDLGTVLVQYLPIHYSSDWVGWWVLAGIACGTPPGALMGLAQWAMLRGQIPHASRWLLTALLGWSCFFALVYWTGWGLPPLPAGD